MEIRQLRYFLAVYQYSNISKAAQKLYITQQTLSKQLREFETELGVPLFIRRTKGVEPTEYAKCLLSPAKQIVRAMDNAQRMLDEMRHQEPMTVRIGMVRGGYHDGSPLSPGSFSNGNGSILKLPLRCRNLTRQPWTGCWCRRSWSLHVR